jgi:hypothetical protein
MLSCATILMHAVAAGPAAFDVPAAASRLRGRWLLGLSGQIVTARLEIAASPRINYWNPTDIARLGYSVPDGCLNTGSSTITAGASTCESNQLCLYERLVPVPRQQIFVNCKAVAWC